MTKMVFAPPYAITVQIVRRIDQFVTLQKDSVDLARPTQIVRRTNQCVTLQQESVDLALPMLTVPIRHQHAISLVGSASNARATKTARKTNPYAMIKTIANPTELVLLIQRRMLGMLEMTQAAKTLWKVVDVHAR